MNIKNTVNYKILCSDLDGTLLTTKSDVSDFTASEIARIKKQLRIVLVSARMPKGMTYLQRRLGIEHEPLICYNGAYVVQGEEELSSTEIEFDHVVEIHKMAAVHFIKLGLYHKNEWYVAKNTERVRKEIRNTQATPIFKDTSDTIQNWKERQVSAHKIMLMGTKTTSDILFAELNEKFKNELHIYRSNDTLMEIAPKSVSKLSAIELLLRENESLKDIIAFGDNYNDLEMLQSVGHGVAVGNAREEVKAFADSVTLNNTEDGVAHFIKQHINI